MGRVLAIDLGTKRIGIALSDPTAMIATPLETVTGAGGRRAAERVADLCRRHDVAAVVVGWPRNMDGSRGPAARQAEAFAERLRTALSVPVELWDERLSTAAAERALIEADVRREERRRSRDRVAAAVILQGYLDARRTAAGAVRLSQNESGHKEERP
ncbi:MAG TPA: Holliday junction resolvase RuvX [bacterium]|nr:Holliday junction resolvase RuvX [bacterium]